MVRLSLLNSVTQRQKSGLGQEASHFLSFFFFVASLSISHSFFSLLGNGQEKKKKTHRLTENLASTRMFISLLSLSLALACKKGIQREAETKKRAWQNRSSFSICFLLSASGTKLVLGPRKVSALFC